MAEAMTATGQPMCPHTTGLFFPWKQGTRSPAAPPGPFPFRLHGGPGQVRGLLPLLPTLRGRAGEEALPLYLSLSTMQKCNIAKMIPIWKAEGIRSQQAWLWGGVWQGLCAEVIRRPCCRPHPGDLMLRAWSSWPPGLPRAQPRGGRTHGGAAAGPQRLRALGIYPRDGEEQRP